MVAQFAFGLWRYTFGSVWLNICQLSNLETVNLFPSDTNCVEKIATFVFQTHDKHIFFTNKFIYKKQVNKNNMVNICLPGLRSLLEVYSFHTISENIYFHAFLKAKSTCVYIGPKHMFPYFLNMKTYAAIFSVVGLKVQCCLRQK